MTTYTIGHRNNIVYAQYANRVGEPIREANIYDDEDGGSNIYETDISDWADMLAAEVLGMIIRPFKEYEYLVWDDINNNWIIDYNLFNPLFRDEMKKKRNSLASSVIEYNGLFVKNVPSERALVNEIITFLKSQGTDFTVDWKGEPVDDNKNEKFLDDGYTPNPNYDPNHPDAQPRWTTAKLADFEGVLLSGGLVTQYAFKAEKFVLDEHFINPYDNFDDAEFDLEDKFNELMGV